MATPYSALVEEFLRGILEIINSVFVLLAAVS
jgi:hypothetical protein